MSDKTDKAAMLRMSLTTDSGYKCDETHRVSADQWARITEIANGQTTEEKSNRVEKNGIESIAAERRRQVEDEGFVDELDDGMVCGELAAAAACYLLNWLSIGNADFESNLRNVSRKLWPFAHEWFRTKDRRSDLVKAGALVAAEVDRIDRAAGKSNEE